ncbi:hypothetical protein BJ912DRAFT_1062752 [Pholiota molesta]|nr:hypothetical protein BJ912DRAFT_1062752 [Pholiota molesta]
MTLGNHDFDDSDGLLADFLYNLSLYLSFLATFIVKTQADYQISAKHRLAVLAQPDKISEDSIAAATRTEASSVDESHCVLTDTTSKDIELHRLQG